MQVQRQFVDVTQRKIFIEFPESFVNHCIELIALTVDEQPLAIAKHRQPHPDIAGKGRTLGDLIEPAVDETDWECLK